MSNTNPPGRPPHPDVLTPAEWRVAEGVRHGLSNPAIAERLGISRNAVKFHIANALSKLGFSRRGELRLWNGVRRDSNLGAAAGSAFNVGPVALGSLGQIARSVTNIAEAECWWRDVLGLPHLYSFGKLAFFDCGGTRLMLTEAHGETNSILYFRVPDIAASCAALAARGVEVTNAPHLIHRHTDGTEEWMAFFSDNEGRPLALMAQVPPRDGVEEKQA